ncbi:MAG: hypothetical protein WBA91_12865 [Paracoccaceae bacterium]
MQVSVRMVAVVAVATATAFAAGQAYYAGKSPLDWSMGSAASAATSAQAALSAATPAKDPDVVAVNDALSTAAPLLPDLPPTASLDITSSLSLAAKIDAITSSYETPDSPALRATDQFGRTCSVPTLTLATKAPAVVDLNVSASCHTNEKVIIRQGAMVFAERLDNLGNLSMTLPALKNLAKVSVELDSGLVLEEARLIPDFGLVQRLAVMTRGKTSGIHLNGYTNGATFNSAGHFRADNPGNADLSDQVNVTVLGDPTLPYPMMAEVITTATGSTVADIEISVEVNSANCGHDLLATTLATGDRLQPTVGAISFSMPDCSAIGQRLVMSADVVDRFATLAAAR